MTDVQPELLELARGTFHRLRTRLAGLTDAEYFWEPAPDGWTIRKTGDGSYRADDTALPPDPAPVTTIVWRVFHITDVLAQERNATWLGLDPEGPDEQTAAPTAAEAIVRLEAAYARFERALTAVSEAELAEPVGPIGGQYANATRIGFVLHELDELIHHGAEVGVLRDLYQALHAPERDDPTVHALLAADRDEIARFDTAAIEAVRREQPALVARAAASGRWEAVQILVELGFDVNAVSRRTALHDAAGAGNLEMVRFLVEHEGDTTAIDGDFQATPLGWAEYFRRADVVDYLGGLE